MSRKQKTADGTGKKKRFRRWQMVLIIIAAIIILLVLVTAYNIARSNGTFSAGNADEYSV